MLQAKNKYILVAMLLFLLVNFPLLSAANKKVLVGGFPLLFVYIGSVMVLAVVALYFITNKRKRNSNE